MEVCAEHVVHIFGPETCRVEALEVGDIEVLEHRERVRATVAIAWINHDHLAVDGEDPALEGEVEGAVLSEKVWSQPRLMCGDQFLVLGDERHRHLECELFDAVYFGAPDADKRHLLMRL